ncbi:MAG TPA: HAMP domain-containing sensor histidine kinase [Rhizomicrobium sp.]|jgi:signal transduction histidine kinase|nr:HAMP domain-containing sensor histidine kinase [Rhizomicrobium sp.]
MTTIEQDDFTKVRGAESRLEFLAAGSFTILLLGTLAFVHTLFEPIMPSSRLWSWTGPMAAVIVIMAVVPGLVLYLKPNDDQIVRIWSPVGKIVAVLYDTAIAASVWILLPFASEHLRLVMVIFYAAAVAGQVIATAESLYTVAYGVIAIFGSTSAFFFIAPGPYSTPIALFLLAYGAMMMGLAVALKQAMRSAIRARIQAETASSDLAAALDKVTLAQTAKNRFIAAATHDLRQPLQAAALFFDQSVKGRDAEARLQAFDGARMAFGETNALLDQILDHLRLDAGGVEARCTAEPVERLVSRVAAEVAPIAAVQGVAIRTVASSAEVAADINLSIRILRNFVQNALRHARCETILIGARRHGARLRIYVLDDGAGVAGDDIPLLFEEYAQGAESRGKGGMGLGLASSRRLAALMDGRADYDARWQHGAAFFLELPIAR